MEFADYIRKPFTVKAVQITVENIEELSEHIGILRKSDDGSPFIQVNNLLIPNVTRVRPGFWLTKMGDNYRCFSNNVFRDQFMPKPFEAATVPVDDEAANV